MISRMLVLVLALVGAAAQMSRGAWIEAAGLCGLAAGLAVLRFLPRLRWLALAGFAVTAAAMIVVASRLLGLFGTT